MPDTGGVQVFDGIEQAAAGLVVLLLAGGVFLAVDVIVPDFPGPRGGGVWATTNTPLL